MAHDAAREHDRGNVGDVAGLVEDHLVTRVAGRPQREVDRLRCADGDQDLGLRVVADAVAAFEVLRERAPELDRAEVRGVVGAALAQALDARLDDLAGRVEVGLPHPEADDVVHGDRRSKKRRIPDGGTARTRCASARSASGGRLEGSVVMESKSTR